MSVPRSEFESGEDLETADEQILRFLRQHPHQAFTLAEISDGVQRQGRTAGWDALPKETRLALVDLHLEGLLRAGDIEARRIPSPAGWRLHYACRRVTKRPCVMP
jgi:hypothetical protein